MAELIYDNGESQTEEIQALSSIYDKDFVVIDEKSKIYRIMIREGTQLTRTETIYLKVTLPPEYPSHGPPLYNLFAPSYSDLEKQVLSADLEDIYLNHLGENIIYLWVEKIREGLQSNTEIIDTTAESLRLLDLYEVDSSSDSDDETSAQAKSKCEEIPSSNTKTTVPTITHGVILTENRSSFQGHAAAVTSLDEVKLVLQKLKSTRKLVKATSNMYAYRIYQQDSKDYLTDCEDDGETKAGSRLSHFLEISNCSNVLVMVSRWFGGIHIGPERFKYIIDAAKIAIEDARLMQEKDSTTTRTKTV